MDLQFHPAHRNLGRHRENFHLLDGDFKPLPQLSVDPLESGRGGGDRGSASGFAIGRYFLVLQQVANENEYSIFRILEKGQSAISCRVSLTSCLIPHGNRDRIFLCNMGLFVYMYVEISNS